MMCTCKLVVSTRERIIGSVPLTLKLSGLKTVNLISGTAVMRNGDMVWFCYFTDVDTLYTYKFQPVFLPQQFTFELLHHSRGFQRKSCQNFCCYIGLGHFCHLIPFRSFQFTRQYFRQTALKTARPVLK